MDREDFEQGYMAGWRSIRETQPDPPAGRLAVDLHDLEDAELIAGDGDALVDPRPRLTPSRIF